MSDHPASKPRFPTDAPMLPSGTLFWIDKDEIIREKRYCAGCKKSLLVRWSFKTLPLVTCIACAKK